ncbi:MAG: hypothetical protein WBE18_04415, partial [Gammaproteobacteria bacterium]
TVFPSAAAVLSPPTIGFANDLTPLDAATAGSAARASHFPAFSGEKYLNNPLEATESLINSINEELKITNINHQTIVEQLIPNVNRPYVAEVNHLLSRPETEIGNKIESLINSSFKSLGYEIQSTTIKNSGNKWEIRDIILKEIIPASNNEPRRFTLPGEMHLSLDFPQKIETSNRFLHEIFSKERFSESGWQLLGSKKKKIDDINENATISHSISKTEAANQLYFQGFPITEHDWEKIKKLENTNAKKNLDENGVFNKHIENTKTKIRDEIAQFMRDKIKFAEVEKELYDTINSINSDADQLNNKLDSEKTVAVAKTKELTTKILIKTKLLLDKTNPPTPKQLQAWQRYCEAEIETTRRQLAKEFGFDGLFGKLKLAILRLVDAYKPLFFVTEEKEAWQTKLRFFDNNNMNTLKEKVKLVTKYEASSAIVNPEIKNDGADCANMELNPANTVI